MPVNNTIYLRRRSKIVVPAGGGELLPANYVASVVRNVEALGYAFSGALIDACRALALDDLVALYQTLIPDLRALRGAHREFAPMYPNFPAQVMEMSEGELYLNAIVHYWSRGALFPVTEVKERFPLLDEVDLTMIDLGSEADFETLFGKIAGANVSLSVQDKEDLTWFVESFGDAIGALLPAAIPQRENVAFVAGLLMRHASRDRAIEFIGTYIKTATDVLRLAVAQSDGGDISLASATKFRTFSRPERGLLLALLERLANPVEDMLRWKGRWIRLGEKLHPREHAKKFPNAARAFAVLRDDAPYTTFNGHIEKALADKNVMAALSRLAPRPGELARRLDHLLRLGRTTAERYAVVEAFSFVAPNVSTPVLLQVRQHFLNRNEGADLRVFFPKGNLGRSQGIPNELPELPADVCARLVTLCETALRERFAALPPLGNVYIDPELADYMAPFAMRSASKSLRTLVRGSRIPLPACEVLRFFVWWKNGKGETDIDLSATLLDSDFTYINVLSYYNLKDFGGVHSGDIVDAPEGASEFIDVSLEKLAAANVRYIVMTLHSYSRQPFAELPECFAGWMARQTPPPGLIAQLLKPFDSGEIFEPKTVKDRLDLTADTTIAIPLVIDIEDRKVIWCDIALRSHPKWQNNVAGNLSGMNITLRSLVTLKKPNLYDLLRLHAEARGTLVDTSADADTVYSVENGTPFRLETIGAEFMG